MYMNIIKIPHHSSTVVRTPQRHKSNNDIKIILLTMHAEEEKHRCTAGTEQSPSMQHKRRSTWVHVSSRTKS